MMETLHYYVLHIPIVSTILSTAFAIALFRRYADKGGTHLFWWGLGFVTFGLGTFSESWNTLFGWNEVNFKFWYIVGAFLGGWPLAQGSIYLLMNRKFAHVSATLITIYLTIASVFVILSPVDKSLAPVHTFPDIEGFSIISLSGKVLLDSFVRLFSIPVNIFSLIFLSGGAAWSAWLFRKNSHLRGRYVGNILIAIGALLPGIGGSMARAGMVEILYITEFLGIVLIYGGYRCCISVRQNADELAAERTSQSEAVPAT